MYNYNIFKWWTTSGNIFTTHTNIWMSFEIMVTVRAVLIRWMSVKWYKKISIDSGEGCPSTFVTIMKLRQKYLWFSENVWQHCYQGVRDWFYHEKRNATDLNLI